MVFFSNIWKLPTCIHIQVGYRIVISLALGVNMVDTTTEPRTGLSPADVANMSLIELIDCLESLGDTSQFGTRFQYQNRIFQLIHECYGMSDKLPPIARVKDIVTDFKEERVRLDNLIDEVAKFIYNEELSLPLLKKLGICQTSFWIKEDEFLK
ncbi:uncharacterized protein LOC134185257 [Corticium candelabrum]|uniref:uncharacterized protein LOC134185257 n=1 Tax=Corticium candelabrum TaxID=121492 RepID=UPI002E26E61E|nr:uncharacterized protein LOC134185257 [Corticium candelabrum]